jgi:hypothetical protein
VIDSPGTVNCPRGNSDIWMARAIRSSSSSRFFSSACRSKSSMLAVIWLKEVASSPIWSRVRILILWLKSPSLTRRVPVNSSCTEPVIDRASTSPMMSATHLRPVHW